MMIESSITLFWQTRRIPLEPVGLAAHQPVARALSRRLLAFDDARLLNLKGVCSKGLLIVLGHSAELPWVDGVVYLGRDAAAPTLLLPTLLEPTCPVQLVERALVHHYHQLSLPVVVLPTLSMVASVQGARPIDRRLLQRWLEEQN